jgi:hypothetical protein
MNRYGIILHPAFLCMTKLAELITTSFKAVNLMMNISQQEGAVF